MDSVLDKLVVTEIKTQSDFLADKIKSMIVSGELPKGFAFPNETEFCKSLNVSRSTLREAYKILDTQGFIKRTKHGTYIKDADAIARGGDFVASMELAGNQEMIEFVLALEPEAAALAARKITPEQLQELETLMQACEEAKDQHWRIFMDRNTDFHNYIRQATGNNLIISALAVYYDNFNQNVVAGIYLNNDTPEFRKTALEQHRQLFEALKAHDEEKAKDIESHHLFDDIIELNKNKKS